MWGDILIDFLSDTKHGNWHLNSHIKKKKKCVPECYSLCWKRYYRSTFVCFSYNSIAQRSDGPYPLYVHYLIVLI